MRVAIMALTMFFVSACVTDRPDPVPETGAFNLKYVNVDGDFFLDVQKNGSTRVVQLRSATHPDRVNWTRRDWVWYANELFPQDEISFDGLRMLRGSNLVPVGLESPKAGTPPSCLRTEDTTFAKVQRRVVRAEAGHHAYKEVKLLTDCTLHAGLSLRQQRLVHQRPNPERFPTRYETVVDLDNNTRAEQRNVRLRHVTKKTALAFVHEETTLTRNQMRQVEYAIDRM